MERGSFPQIKPLVRCVVAAASRRTDHALHEFYFSYYLIVRPSVAILSLSTTQVGSSISLRGLDADLQRGKSP